MISHAKQKVKEGKLVKVEVEYNKSITKLRITGDFFLHPEDILERIEHSLTGLEKDASEEAIASRIQKISEACDAQMIGISPASLAHVIKEALK